MKPRHLELFCCQGGSSHGMSRAGFLAYGIDKNPQPKYPHPFHEGDAIDALARLLAGQALAFRARDGKVECLTLDDFASLGGGPPCQDYSDCQRIRGRQHPRLIGVFREKLEATGKPYVIENVEGARGELRNPILLCGLMFGLRTRRHRLFESNLPLEAPPHDGEACSLARHTKMGRPPHDGELMHIVGNFSGTDLARQIMDAPWMNREGLREAVPPAYTEWVGAQLLEHLRAAEAA